MRHLPLPGLLPGDPRNYLSDEARIRLVRAHGEAHKIQWEAVAEIDAKQWNRDGKKARYKINQANLRAAREVLRIAYQEYGKLRLPLNTFWNCIRDEIEGAANSLELYDSQRKLLEAEFFYPEAIATETDVSSRPSLAEKKSTEATSANAPSLGEPGSERKKFVLPILEKKGWSVFDWANESDVAHATAMDYLDAKTKPYLSTRLKLATSLGIPVEQLPK